MNNKYRFTIPGVNQTITIPIEMNWDFYGRDDSVEIYQEDVVNDIIGIPEDFEVIRFSHENYTSKNNTELTELDYNFYFYSGVPSNVSASTINDWITDFRGEGFLARELYELRPQFNKSFFKLDFYDSPNLITQTILFTVILPVYKCSKIIIDLTPQLKNIKINVPIYKTDYFSSSSKSTTNEGFFYYWLKSKTFINVDTFYMSAKFFDAKLGVYVKMMTVPQYTLPNKFVFDAEKYFFNKVVFDYTNKTYKIFDYSGNRIGTNSPIKWYEYVNP